jgi:flavodoxin short chain
MKKLAVVFWTSTGNTELMADAIVEGAKQLSAEVVKIQASQFNMSIANEYDSIAFGCSAMGDEILDEYEFEPMFRSVLPLLNTKQFSLFGSYGWGDGEWMRRWENLCIENSAIPLQAGIIASYTPDESVLSELKQLGKNLVA